MQLDFFLVCEFLKTLQSLGLETVNYLYKNIEIHIPDIPNNCNF